MRDIDFLGLMPGDIDTVGGLIREMEKPAAKMLRLSAGNQ